MHFVYSRCCATSTSIWIQNIFITPDPVPIKQSLPVLPTPSTWQPPIYLRSVGFPLLDILYEWDHATYGLLCLASFTQHVFQVSPDCGVSALHSFILCIVIACLIYGGLTTFQTLCRHFTYFIHSIYLYSVLPTVQMGKLKA